MRLGNAIETMYSPTVLGEARHPTPILAHLLPYWTRPHLLGDIKTGTVQIFFYLVDLFIIILECLPREKIWNPAIALSTNCINVPIKLDLLLMNSRLALKP